LQGIWGVSDNTYRGWDSGRRAAPRAVLHRAKRLQDTECGHLFPLHQLASEYQVHVRTLRKAARDGRLAATFSSRMTFGNLVAFATRQAVEEFKRRYYRQTTTWNRPNISVVSPVPEDYAQRLIHLRARLRLSQQELAVRLGVAGRAIVYQWESERRRPSKAYWERREARRLLKAQRAQRRQERQRRPVLVVVND